MRIALGIEYNGAAFCGWQSQPSGCGVQDHVERALSLFLDETVSVTCAGRTDTGVHALAQVVHLDTDKVREKSSWVRGTNAHLPPAVRVIWAHEVNPGFHARFSARSRTYRYVLLNAPVDNGVLRGLAGWFHMPLDVERMRSALATLKGEHDFSAFRSSECQAKTPVKTLYAANIDQRGACIVFTFRANAFLHHMVRNLVGSAVYVGAGRHDLEDFRRIFESRDRTLAAPTFAPDGLYLADIEYDPLFDLPAFPERVTLF